MFIFYFLSCFTNSNQSLSSQRGKWYRQWYVCYYRYHVIVSKYRLVVQIPISGTDTAKEAINSQKATDSSLRTFMSYLEEKGIDDKQFETIIWPKSQLDEVLSKFYLEARQENGQLYKKSSLFSIRHGINLHLSQFQIDIIKDSEFKESNTTFCANVKELKRQGQGEVNHYPPKEKEDLLKLYNYFDLDNNIKLQNDNTDTDVNQVTFEALSNSQEDKLLLEFADNSDGSDDIFKVILLLGNTENIQPHSSVNPSQKPAVNKMQNVISSVCTYQNQQTLPYPVIPIILHTEFWTSKVLEMQYICGGVGSTSDKLVQTVGCFTCIVKIQGSNPDMNKTYGSCPNCPLSPILYVGWEY
ncbi:hypothetical protein KUTeg_024684 [Tegillarca granosa]|uniref:Uncharacterized protein n=1 Tax=Tegillarca granosa TaxID=220873 RepID=A0ABQ9E4B5_TEGGR|nr:hypothetical protein KUTeg_024684 [Tegillarca granosa]